MAHLSPSAIFSPSIARQQLAAQKDWNYIDSWLSSKYNNKTPPPFERNPETLRALLSICALNESAEEERELLARAEAKTLQELLEKEEIDRDGELLRALEESLTSEGKASLEVLAGLDVELGCSGHDSAKIARGLIEIQGTIFDLEQASHRVGLLEKNLTSELQRVMKLKEELEGEAYQPSDLGKETLDYQRKTKVLAAKLPELRDRMAALSGTMSKITIRDVKAEENKYKESMARVKDLETQVKSYHGLPQDTDLARLELETLRVELRDLTNLRDAMFEGIVERESPKRTQF